MIELPIEIKIASPRVFEAFSSTEFSSYYTGINFSSKSFERIYLWTFEI